MTYTIAGLTPSTIRSFERTLFDLDMRRIAAVGEADKRQDQIDDLEEERDAFTTEAAEARLQATEIATLLAERFAAQPRFSLSLEDNGEDEQQYWEIYDQFAEETLEAYGIDEAGTITAHDRLAQLESERTTHPHPFETVDYWVGVNPREH